MTRNTLVILLVVAIAACLLIAMPACAIKIYANPSIQSTNTSPDGTYTEGQAMQDVANRFMSKLSARGFETRSSGWLDLGPACTDAVNWKANVFVAIHTNAMGGGWQTGARGTEGFYWQSSGGTNVPADITLTNNCVHKCVSKFAAWGRNYDRGTFADYPYFGWNLYVLNNTPNMNSTLIEGLFHDNSADVAVLKTPEGKDAYAQALYEAVCDFEGWSYTTTTWNSAFNAQSYTASMVAGSQATAWVEYKNTGNTTWTNSGSNPVRLGTQNPQDHASVFYTAGDWVNSSRPTNMDQASVAPNGIGRFTFIMTAPQTTGAVQEYYKLVSEGQCWFGDAGVYFTVTTSMPADVIIDNNTSGFSVVGSAWATGTSSVDKYGADYRYHTVTTTDEPATWTPNLPGAGNWQVYAWWPQGSNRSNAARYTVNYSGGSTVVTVNQQANGGVWNSLGTFNFAIGTGGNVKLSNVSSGTSGTVVLADAVKFVKR